MEVEVRPTDVSEGSCATVRVFQQDTEPPVLGQQQWQAVHERRGRGQSISAIARGSELDRKTVRNCLLQPSWQPYRRVDAASLLDPHRQWLAVRAPQVDYSARIPWQDCAPGGGSSAAT